MGHGWGGNNPYYNYYFTQQWYFDGVTGCLADVMSSDATEGLYVWLRGGRTYDLTSPGYIETTIYLSGVTELTGPQFMPKTEGPLYKLMALSVLGMVGGLYYGPPQDNKPYWNASNLPIMSGTWSPYLDDPALTILPLSGTTPRWKRSGDFYNIIGHFVITGEGSLANNRFVVRGLPFDFGYHFRSISVYESNLLAGTPSKNAPATAGISGSEIQFFYKTVTGSTVALEQSQVRPAANGRIELIINSTVAL